MRVIGLIYPVLWPHSMLNPAAVLLSMPLQIQDVSVRVIELMDHVLSMYDRAIGQYTAGQCCLNPSAAKNVQSASIRLLRPQNKGGACLICCHCAGARACPLPC